MWLSKQATVIPAGEPESSERYWPTARNYRLDPGSSPGWQSW